MAKDERATQDASLSGTFAELRATLADSGEMADEAAQFATAALLQVVAQAVGLSLQNAVAAQQRETALAQAVMTRAVKEIMDSDTADLPQRIEQVKAAMDALGQQSGGGAGSPQAMMAELQALLAALKAGPAQEPASRKAAAPAGTKRPRQK